MTAWGIFSEVGLRIVRSALSPKTDVAGPAHRVRKVPIGDVVNKKKAAN